MNDISKSERWILSIVAISMAVSVIYMASTFPKDLRNGVNQSMADIFQRIDSIERRTDLLSNLGENKAIIKLREDK